MGISKEEMEEVIKKYEASLKRQVMTGDELKVTASKELVSREYGEFKSEIMPPPLTIYEKLCGMSEKILNLKPSAAKIPELNEHIRVSHLNITPTGALSFAILAPTILIILGLVFSLLLFNSAFLMVLVVIIAIALIFMLQRLPEFIANRWRMKASNQMVLCIFYIVTYMRHTSNLENALDFAANHIAPPLSLDIRKVLWDVEMEKFDSVSQSLENYLETWRKYNMEFIESIHLIISSLYESSEERRLSLLDKSLSTILNETFEKMLHYAYNLKSPITMLHMLGIILPILGLVILPLVVSFLSGVKWYHLLLLYNIFLPIVVYYLGKMILSKRPTGYGDTDITEINPELKKYKNIIIRSGKNEFIISPLYVSIAIFVVFFFIGLFPLYVHALNPNFDLTFGEFKLLDYHENAEGDIIGPYGLGASVLSLMIPLGLALSIGLYYRFGAMNVIKIREKAKALEKEFSSALFQLGNRLGDGMPVEIAFGKVAETMEGTTSGSFFDLVSSNIKRLGMSVEQAIFDSHQGALLSFPSNVIESSMKVLAESAKKGPLVAASAVISVSEYIQDMHKVDERLKDMLEDIIASMKSQINFLTPVIAGIVIGITSMITTIINRLTVQMSMISSAEGGQAAMSNIMNMFSEGIPTYYFQVIVGIYVVQIVYILSILANGIENGEDKLNERYTLGHGLIRSTMLYVVVAFIIMLLFNIIATSIMGNIATG